jgi:Zn-dependent protease
MGSLFLLLLGFGWAKPVPVNQAKLREKGRLAPILTTAAGAMMNFLLMAILFVVIRVLLQNNQNVSIDLLEILVQFMMINVVLVVFNLLPVPPLDGFMILRNILPDSMDKFFAILTQYGFIILLVILFILPQIGFDPFGNLLSASMNFVWNLLINF